MGEDDEINASGIEAEGRKVASFCLWATLEHSAVHQEAHG